MRYTELVAVLNFIYHGEVNVAQEELNTFLGIAEDLKIKGLSQNTNSKKEINNKNEEMVKKNLPKSNTSPAIKKVKSLAPTPNISVQYNHCQNDEIEEIIPVKTEPHSSTLAALDPSQPEPSFGSQSEQSSGGEQ